LRIEKNKWRERDVAGGERHRIINNTVSDEVVEKQGW
jgi:hypothetical protein